MHFKIPYYKASSFSSVTPLFLHSFYAASAISSRLKKHDNQHILDHLVSAFFLTNYRQNCNALKNATDEYGRNLLEYAMDMEADQEIIIHLEEKGFVCDSNRLLFTKLREALNTNAASKALDTSELKNSEIIVGTKEPEHKITSHSDQKNNIPPLVPEHKPCTTTATEGDAPQTLVAKPTTESAEVTPPLVTEDIAHTSEEARIPETAANAPQNYENTVNALIGILSQPKALNNPFLMPTLRKGLSNLPKEAIFSIAHSIMNASIDSKLPRDPALKFSETVKKMMTPEDKRNIEALINQSEPSLTR